MLRTWVVTKTTSAYKLQEHARPSNDSFGFLDHKWEQSKRSDWIGPSGVCRCIEEQSSECDPEINGRTTKSGRHPLASLTPMSPFLTIVKGNDSAKVSNYPGFCLARKSGAHFRAGREAVRMFLRGPFAFVFYQAINAGRSEQCGSSLRNLLAIY